MTTAFDVPADSLISAVSKELKEVWGNTNRFEFLKEIAINNKNSRVCIAAKEYSSI